MVKPLCFVIHLLCCGRSSIVPCGGKQGFALNDLTNMISDVCPHVYVTILTRSLRPTNGHSAAVPDLLCVFDVASYASVRASFSGNTCPVEETQPILLGISESVNVIIDCVPRHTYDASRLLDDKSLFIFLCSTTHPATLHYAASQRRRHSRNGGVISRSSTAS